jgi:hypothetical protein
MPSRPKRYPIPKNRKQELALEEEKRWDEYNPRFDLYEEMWTVNASQAFDFLDARDHPNDKKRAFSYFLGRSVFSLTDQFSHNLEYRFYPALVAPPENPGGDSRLFHDEHKFSTSLIWTLKRLQNQRRTRTFGRSLTMGYSHSSQPSPSSSINETIDWSLNDFASISMTHSFDTNFTHLKTWGGNLQLIHPSECWGLLLHYGWPGSGKKDDYGFEILLNLTGNGMIGAKNSADAGSSLFGGQ